MLGYYRLNKEQLQKLPSNKKNIEEDIYDLCFPLIIGEELPKNLYYLYNTLEIPVIKFEDLNNYTLKEDNEEKEYIKEFKEYLKLNTEIELLEEGQVGHTLRVARYSLELCNLLKLDKEKTKEIYIASLFHDLGKSQIPSKILSKPGKLNEKEYEIIKTHCEKGALILSDFLDENTLKIILSHHERCDKSGYPKGIEPELGAKILAIADSYDAMTSNRVYKKNKTLKSAQEELIRCTLEVKNGGKGKLYDEEMVRAFINYHGYNVLMFKNK